MSKSSYHSHLPSSVLTTPDLDIQNSMDNNIDNRRTSTFSDKRINNVNYVRTVLRRFFGGHKKSSQTISDESPYEPSSPTILAATTLENITSPVFIHPCLQYDKHTKFSGIKYKISCSFF